MITLVDRQDAVAAIAAHLADRTAFIINIPPALISTAVEHLESIPGWTGHFDNGTPAVLRTGAGSLSLGVAQLLEALGAPFTAVVTVPKTVPAADLGRALDRDIPADGSQDIIGLYEGGPIVWPMLFVEALDRVDPQAAAQLRASGIEIAS